MYKIKTSELKQLFNTVNVKDLINLDSLKSSVRYERAVVVGTVEIDIVVFVLLNDDNGIEFDKMIIDFKTVNSGLEIPYLLENWGACVNLFDELENKVKIELTRQLDEVRS